MEKIIASFWVDPQNCFTSHCPDELPVPDAQAIVPALLAQRQYARYQLVSVDAHPEHALWETTDRHCIGKALPDPHPANIDAYWPRHAIVGTFGQSLIAGLPALHSGAYDCIVEKGTQTDCHPYGALYLDLQKLKPSPALTFLKAKYVSHVIVGGIATEFCVFETVKQLLENNFIVILNLEACRGFPGSTQAAIASMTAEGVLIAKNLDEIDYLLKIK